MAASGESLSDAAVARIERIGARRWRDGEGWVRTALTEDEVRNLSIRRGEKDGKFPRAGHSQEGRSCKAPPFSFRPVLVLCPLCAAEFAEEFAQESAHVP